MVHEYPYTDLHEVNLDWFIKRIKELEIRVEKLEGSFEEVKQLVDDLNATVQALEQLVNQLNERVENVEEDVTDLQEALDTLGQSLIALANRMSSLETVTEGLTVDVEQLKTDVAGIQSSVGQLQTAVSGLASRVSALENAGGGGTVKRATVWQNGAQSSFAGTTIGTSAIDDFNSLNQLLALKVYYSENSSGYTARQSLDYDLHNGLGNYVRILSVYDGKFSTRDVTFNSFMSGVFNVTISDGYVYNNYGNINTTVQNAACVPRSIEIIYTVD